MTYAIFVREETTDSAELAVYSQMAPATLTGHPAIPLAAYGRYEVLEGSSIEGAVILQFPTMADAKAWYESAEYREARRHRLAGASYRVILVEGLG